MNNRLKSLIQSRQNQKEIHNVQNHNSFGSGPVPVSPHPPPHPSFAGQSFIVVQQQSNNGNNTSLSPHYANTSVPPNQNSGQPFPLTNWSQQEHEDSGYHKNINGITDKVVAQTGRRTPYNSTELQNGFVVNHTFNHSNDTQNSNNNNANNNNNNNKSSSNNISAKNNSNNNTIINTSSPFIPTTTYSTNQSFTSPSPQEYSLQETNASVIGNPRTPNQRPSSRSSPARAVKSPASSTKSVDSESMVTMNSNGISTTQVHNSEQNSENEPFLVNTTTTMHLNHDLITSMNTSTGIINSYNMSPNSQSSAYYPTSLYMPSIGLLDPSSPTVIMNVSGTELEANKRSLEESQISLGHTISGIDCGRIVDSLDSNSGLNLMDLSSMTSFIKSNPTCDPISSSLLHSIESHHTMTSLSNASPIDSMTTTTVLPPVSTFLLPNFRDQNWWDRNLDKLKSNTKDMNDCECYAPEEREYSSSTSPSTLTTTTTLPASLSN